jgi:hypothetical protein
MKRTQRIKTSGHSDLKREVKSLLDQLSKYQQRVPYVSNYSISALSEQMVNLI